jgi:phage baseplate assembly protein gpV
MSDDLLNLIRREIERFHASRYTERHGLVTSYDPDKHLAKVTFQPEGQESGWLPVETNHMGDGYGILIGLTPGHGKGDGSKNAGDQVIIRYQEGDFESGKIVKVVHSDQDKPPRVEAGEMLIKHKSGSSISWNKDGEIIIEQASGAKLYFKKDGSVEHTTKDKPITINSGSAQTALKGQDVVVNG